MKYFNAVRKFGAVVVGSAVVATANAATTSETVTGAISDGTTVVQLVVGGVVHPDKPCGRGVDRQVVVARALGLYL